MNASEIIIDSLRARVSVRAFTNEPISAEELGESKEALDRAKFMKSIGDN